MPAYKIDIDGRIYEGHYASKANAVFGAMRKDDCRCRGLRPNDGSTYGGPTWQPYIEAQHRKKEEEIQPSLVGVEIVTDRKIPQKVRRIS